jgi:hypothetical protein
MVIYSWIFLENILNLGVGTLLITNLKVGQSHLSEITGKGASVTSGRVGFKNSRVEYGSPIFSM